MPGSDSRILLFFLPFGTDPGDGELRYHVLVTGIRHEGEDMASRSVKENSTVKKTGSTAEEKKEKRLELLEKTQAALNTEFGTGTVTSAGGSIDVETISTGSWCIDSITGGGFPRGRIVEIYGKEASGKTSIALNAIADVQRKGGNAVFIDMEDALDPRYARELGVDTDKLLVSRPESAEQAVKIIERFIQSGAVDIIVLDSVAAMVPQKDLDADIDKDTMATRARLMSKMLPRILNPAMKTNTCVVFINQFRTDINVMFGNPNRTTGGNAMKYYASQRILVNRQKPEIDKETGIALRTPIKVRVDKNKIAPPLMSCVTFLTNGKGIDKDQELYDLCMKFGIFKQSGKYIKDAATEEVLGQGQANVVEKIEKNEDGIKDKYLPLMKAHLNAVGAADDNEILKQAISRNDKETIAAMKARLHPHHEDEHSSEDD